MTKNQNATALTEEEQKATLKELLFGELFSAIIGAVFLFFIFLAINNPFLNWTPPKTFRIICLSVTGIGLLTIYIRIFFGYIRKYRNFKKGIYAYYHLDVLEYRPGVRSSYEVWYQVGGKKDYTTTTKNGITKVHVFECGGDPLAVVDEKSCK